MNINLSLLQDGLVVLSVGFFVVFTFLSILIFAMGIMSSVVAYLNKIFPTAQLEAAPQKVSSGVEEEIAVAIASVMMRK